MQIDQNAPEGFFQANREALEQSMRCAVQDALREHKAFGNPIAIWRNGKVMIVPPDKIALKNAAVNGTESNGANGE
jgi:hypothetical protein